MHVYDTTLLMRLNVLTIKVNDHQLRLFIIKVLDLILFGHGEALRSNEKHWEALCLNNDHRPLLIFKKKSKITAISLS